MDGVGAGFGCLFEGCAERYAANIEPGGAMYTAFQGFVILTTAMILFGSSFVAGKSVVAALSAVLLAERLSSGASVAIVLAACGIAQLNQTGEMLAWPDLSTATGMLLALGAVICEGVFTIVGKVLARDLSPLAIAAHVSLIGLVMVLPVGIIGSAQLRSDGHRHGRLGGPPLVGIGEWGWLFLALVRRRCAGRSPCRRRGHRCPPPQHAPALLPGPG